MSDGLERRVEWLVAREEIRDVIARYARAGDAHNDPRQLEPLFTRDAVWQAAGFGRYEGREQILRELAAIGRDRILWSLHYPVAPIVELAEDRRSARAEWWLWELLTLADATLGSAGPPSNKWLGATYEADFRREADGWRIARLVLRIQKLVDSAEGPNEAAAHEETPGHAS